MKLPKIGIRLANAIWDIAALTAIAIANLAIVVPTAVARTAQVCPGPALPPAQCFTVDTSVIGGRAFEEYVVTRRGTLLFDSGIRKGQLATLSPDTIAQYCAVNPGAATKGILPTITFTSAKVVINASVFPENGQTRIDDVASIVFTGLQTSDGFGFQKFALNFARQRGQSRVGLQFRPDLGSNVTEIPGLTSDWFFVDIATGQMSFPRLGGMPEPLRRLVLAIAYRLPAIFASATQVMVIPGPADPQWSTNDIAAIATQFSAFAFVTPQPLFPPIVTLTCDLGDGATTCNELPALWSFRDYFARYGADYLSAGDPATASVLLANLRSWSTANALSVFPGIQVGQPNQPDFRPKYEIQRLLVPMITTWSLLRQDSLVTPADRMLIDGWLDRVVAYATEPFGGPQNDYNPFNVGYLTLGVRMAWGIITGNNLAVGEGIERIYMGLNQMRPDGSFPREAARGACAMNYQNLETLSLLFLAELAANQGYDAYALSVNGRTLHDAVKFVLDAVDNPAIIAGYAAMDPTNCTLPLGSPVDFGFTVRTDPNGQTYSAWVEPYLARFPTHPNAARVANLLQGGLAANRSVFQQLSGGNTTCFYAGAKVGAPVLPNYQGMWAAPNLAEAGWGINFTHQGDILFASWFSYDSGGRPFWLSMTAQLQSDGSFTGPIDHTGGPAFSAVPYDPTLVTHSTVGTGRVTFSDGNNGSFSYTVNGVSQVKALSRFVFAAPVPVCTFNGALTAAQAHNYTDMWAVPNLAEPGWGINFTHQGDVIFASWFIYDTNGVPFWVSATLAKTVAGTYTGALDATTGPPFNSVPFDSSRITHSSVGTATVTFADGNNGTFTYTLNGVSRTKALTRFVFVAPGTVCQ